MSDSSKDTILSIAVGAMLMAMFIGIPTEGGMWGGYFWKALYWAIQNGWF